MRHATTGRSFQRAAPRADGPRGRRCQRRLQLARLVLTWVMTRQAVLQGPRAHSDSHSLWSREALHCLSLTGEVPASPAVPAAQTKNACKYTIRKVRHATGLWSGRRKADAHRSLEEEKLGQKVPETVRCTLMRLESAIVHCLAMVPSAVPAPCCGCLFEPAHFSTRQPF